MVHDGVTNYVHVHDGDGETVFVENRTVQFSKIIGNSQSSSSSYEHVADIIYDRKKHTAKVEWKLPIYVPTRSASVDSHVTIMDDSHVKPGY